MCGHSVGLNRLGVSPRSTRVFGEPVPSASHLALSILFVRLVLGDGCCFLTSPVPQHTVPVPRDCSRLCVLPSTETVALSEIGLLVNFFTITPSMSVCRFTATVCTRTSVLPLHCGRVPSLSWPSSLGHVLAL